MGDLKDATPAGDAKAENETKDAEVVDMESGNDNAGKDKTLALNAQMAQLLLANPLLSFPKVVRSRVLALKNLQLQHVNMEVDFFKELHQLEMKYEKLFQPLYDKRADIVTGAYEPTEEECKFTDSSNVNDEEAAANDLEKLKAENDKQAVTQEEKDIKGIPEFWLTAFKNAPAVADMIEDHDEPILRHLTSLKASTSFEPMSFTLEFHFEPNEFFTNTILTKYYEMRCAPDETDVFAFEGPEIVKCKGCTIDWVKGKNVTVKTIKKKQKHKARGAVRTITKTIQNDSFFNFFSPPNIPEDPDDIDEEMQTVLNNDFEVGNLMKDRMIPHAVLFFTGENLLDDEFDEDDDDEDDEDEYEEGDEEDSEDGDENDSSNRKKSRGQGGNAPQAPPECKQQ